MHESGEMYLETILILSQSDKKVRAVDICEHMGFSKPSVSRAMSILKNDEYINIDGHGYITLTETGKKIAETIYERHTVLTAAFKAMGISDKTAEDDACRIEHVISDETFQAIKNHLKQKTSL